ncbi:MAG TPA: hypothetical protein VMR45_00765 [Patescibacteria group bacterium]|nr:hypothetical protein [Patescibacteria group bacterium]
MNEGGNNSSKRTKKKILIISCALIFLAVASTAGYFGWQLSSLKKNPNKANQDTVSRVTKEVGKIYELPTGEKPTVAQIQDKSKLAGQTFFDKSKNGDYVILYQTAKLALLYRETDKKLINVGPINLDNQQAQATTSSDPSSAQSQKTTTLGGSKSTSAVDKQQ